MDKLLLTSERLLVIKLAICSCFLKKELGIPKIKFGSGDIFDHIGIRMSSDTPGKFSFSPIIFIII